MDLSTRPGAEVLRYVQVSKEAYSYGKKGLLDLSTRPGAEVLRDIMRIFVCAVFEVLCVRYAQVSKEAYSYGKRDLGT